MQQFTLPWITIYSILLTLVLWLQDPLSYNIVSNWMLRWRPLKRSTITSTCLWSFWGSNHTVQLSLLGPILVHLCFFPLPSSQVWRCPSRISATSLLLAPKFLNICTRTATLALMYFNTLRLASWGAWTSNLGKSPNWRRQCVFGQLLTSGTHGHWVCIPFFCAYCHFLLLCLSCSLFIAYCSLLIAHCSLLAAHCLLITLHLSSLCVHFFTYFFFSLCTLVSFHSCMCWNKDIGQ